MITEAMQFHHTLLELLAGGPGSGCHGPTCGRPRGVKQQFMTTQGHTYTLFKPSRKGIPRGKSDYKKKTSPFKGQFQALKGDVIPGVEGKRNRVAGIYDAAYGKGDTREGEGVTVIVHRDFKNMRVVVQEFPHDDMNKIAEMRSFKFKNFGQAAGFLNKRYAIKQKLPRPGPGRPRIVGSEG